MISTQYINLNMVPSGVMPVLYCSQYDIGRPLGVVVYNGAESVDLSVYTCTIEATRTDKTPVTAAVTTSGNIGVFETTATMTNQADTYKGKLVLTDGNGKRVASLAFVLVVTVRTMDEDAEEIEEDASLYQQYTGTVQTIIASIRADLAAEVTARQNAITTEANARAAAVSAEAAARQSADNTLQSNINAEASTRATADTSLQSQIDQLIAPSGDAPSAAEVENARIGSDGTVYPTLGDAIRTQNSLLKSALSELGNTGKKRNDYGITWNQGYMSFSNGAITITSNLQYVYSDFIDITDMDTDDYFFIKAPAGYNLYALAVNKNDFTYSNAWNISWITDDIKSHLRNNEAYKYVILSAYKTELTNFTPAQAASSGIEAYSYINTKTQNDVEETQEDIARIDGEIATIHDDMSVSFDIMLDPVSETQGNYTNNGSTFDSASSTMTIPSGSTGYKCFISYQIYYPDNVISGQYNIRTFLILSFSSEVSIDDFEFDNYAFINNSWVAFTSALKYKEISTGKYYIWFDYTFNGTEARLMSRVRYKNNGTKTSAITFTIKGSDCAYTYVDQSIAIKKLIESYNYVPKEELPDDIPIAIPTRGQIVYAADNAVSSGHIVNAVAYQDGVIIACRSNGKVVRIGYGNEEETLLSLNGSNFDWRLCWMDSNENVYVSPHASYGTMIMADRGLYRLVKGGTSFEKVLSLYDTSSSVTTETQENNDTIWTMCEDRDGNLYAGVYAHTIRANPAIYKSTNGGTAWTYIFNFKTSGLTPNGLHIHSIVYDKWKDALYCIVGEINTVFKSVSGASTWINLNVAFTDKGASMISTKYGLFIGSDNAYNCEIYWLHNDDATHETVFKGWANVIFAIRQSDITGFLYAFTRIDSSVNDPNSFPLATVLDGTTTINQWKDSVTTYNYNRWKAYHDSVEDEYPDDAIRPQHYAILVSKNGGMTWEILIRISCASTRAYGFWTTGFFLNGECVTGQYDASGFDNPLVISEGKHKYVSGGCNLDGEIFVKTNISTTVHVL